MKENNKILYDYINGVLIAKNKRISFSYLENEVMKILVTNKENFVDRREITSKVYGKDWTLYCDSNISVLISRIRKKLDGILQIDNKFGFGYKLRKFEQVENIKQGEGIYEI